MDLAEMEEVVDRGHLVVLVERLLCLVIQVLTTVVVVAAGEEQK
jgi:hypothetical protein